MVRIFAVPFNAVPSWDFEVGAGGEGGGDIELLAALGGDVELNGNIVDELAGLGQGLTSAQVAMVGGG